MVIIGFDQQKDYETIVIVDGEEVEDALQWPGISQTIKKFIAKENIEMT